MIPSYRISSMEQYFSFYMSENKEYTIVWQEDGRKSFIKIFRNNKVILFQLIKNIDKCWIANNGNYVLSFYKFGKTLNSHFMIYNTDNELLIEKKFKAINRNGEISPTGNFFICHKANNPKSTDGNKLTLFNILDKKIQWSVKPLFWASIYVFDEVNGIVILDSLDHGQIKIQL